MVPFPLRVVSVERSLFEGDVDFMLANGADGELGILPRHAPLMTILKPGPLKIQATAGTRSCSSSAADFSRCCPTASPCSPTWPSTPTRSRSTRPRRRVAGAQEKLAGTLTASEETRVPERACDGGSEAAPRPNASRVGLSG